MEGLDTNSCGRNCLRPYMPGPVATSATARRPWLSFATILSWRARLPTRNSARFLPLEVSSQDASFATGFQPTQKIYQDILQRYTEDPKSLRNERAGILGTRGSGGPTSTVSHAIPHILCVNEAQCFFKGCPSTAAKAGFRGTRTAQQRLDEAELNCRQTTALHPQQLLDRCDGCRFDLADGQADPNNIQPTHVCLARAGDFTSAITPRRT